jgi:ABC-2 type transport system permease protein
MDLAAESWGEGRPRRLVPRWPLAVFSMELRKIFSYRMDFWIQFVGSLAAQFGVAWFLWKAIFAYQGTARIGAYSFAGMMLYYVAAPLVARTVQGAEMGNMSLEIYEGSLTRYLVYPVSFFGYKLAANCAHALVFLIQFTVVMLLFASIIGIPPEFDVNVAGCAQAAVTMVLSMYLYFTIVSTIELSAFWADNVWSLVVIFRFLNGLLGGAMIPLSLFPQWSQHWLSVLPFGYLIYFPVQSLLGQLDGAAWLRGLGVLTLWSLAGTGAYVWLWRRGKYQYTGVGI